MSMLVWETREAAGASPGRCTCQKEGKGAGVESQYVQARILMLLSVAPARRWEKENANFTGENNTVGEERPRGSRCMSRALHLQGQQPKYET